MLRSSLTFLTSMGLCLACVAVVLADDQQDAAEATGKTIEVFDAGTITTPESWRAVQPKVSIIQYEFAATTDEQDGVARVTMMAASGSVDANIERWKSQFKIAGDEGVQQETKTINGHTVHLVDLAGTYNERMGGPFAGGRVVERDDYAMAGAIIVDPKERKFFIKMIGPAGIVKANREAFGEMVKGLKTK